MVYGQNFLIRICLICISIKTEHVMITFYTGVSDWSSITWPNVWSWKCRTQIQWSTNHRCHDRGGLCAIYWLKKYTFSHHGQAMKISILTFGYFGPLQEFNRKKIYIGQYICTSLKKMVPCKKINVIYSKNTNKDKQRNIRNIKYIF